jgi:hypothetical protein
MISRAPLRLTLSLSLALVSDDQKQTVYFKRFSEMRSWEIVLRLTNYSDLITASERF